MNLGLKSLATSAAIGAFALVAMGAGSATAGKIICNSACGPNGTFIPGSVGTIKSFHAHNDNNNVYNFTFTIGPPGGTDALTQLAAAAFTAGNPLPIAFSLFSGTPGNPTFITKSPYQVDSTLSLPLDKGKYFIQLVAADVAQNKELVSGGLAVAAVPEPAAWSMMIMGLALIGAGLRQRRTAPALV
jgi:hypothetical protein